MSIVLKTGKTMSASLSVHETPLKCRKLEATQQDVKLSRNMKQDNQPEASMDNLDVDCNTP